MASSESWEMLERWKAEHPELPGDRPAPPPRQRPRLVAAPDPPALAAPLTEQLEMIERWRRENPGIAARVATGQARTSAVVRSEPQSESRGLALGDASLSVLSAFVVGAIIGGIVMTIITGIAFWGFSGG